MVRKDWVRIERANVGDWMTRIALLLRSEMYTEGNEANLF